MSGAELGLAITGVAATGAALSKALFDIYHTVRHAPRDIKDIATYLELLRTVLKELQRVISRHGHVCSPEAGKSIRDLLQQCEEIFNEIEELTASLQPGTSSALDKTPLKEKLRWHFKKDEITLLKSRLEAMKSTIHLMVSIIQLRGRLSPPASKSGVPKKSQARLTSALRAAGELVEGERNCLADLLLVEEQIELTATQEFKFTRISSWLSGITGLSDDGSAPSVASGRSNWTLSAAQRSITGHATGDVEMLLEKWTMPVLPPQNSSKPMDSSPSDHVKDMAEGAVVDDTETVAVHDHQHTNSIHENENVNDPQLYSNNSDSLSSDAQTSTESTSSRVSSSSGHVPDNISNSSSSISDSTSSQESGSVTPTRLSNVERENALSRSPQSNLESVPMKPKPILAVGGYEDNETVRDLRRASFKNHRVRIHEPHVSMGNLRDTSMVEQWLASSAIAGNTESLISASEQGSGIKPGNHQTPFDQISILSFVSPSATDSMSTLGDTDIERQLHRTIKTGNSLIRLKRYSEAATLFREAYKIKKRRNESDDAEMLDIRFKIGILFGELCKYPSAERVLISLGDLQCKTLGKEAKATQSTKHYLARIYSRQEKWAEASKTYHDLWVSRKAFLQGGTDPGPLIDIASRTGCEYGQVLIEIYHAQQDTRDSLLQAKEVLHLVHTSSKLLRGEMDMKFTLAAGVQLGCALRCLNESEEALRILNSVQVACETLGDLENSCTIRCAHEISMVYHQQSKFKICEPLATVVWNARATSRQSKFDFLDIENANCLASSLRALARNEEAREILHCLHGALSEKLGEDHPRTISATRQLTDILVELDEEEELEGRLRKAMIASRPITSESVTEDQLDIAEKLGPLLLRREQKPEAADVYDAIFLGEKKFLGIDSPLTLSNGHEYGSLCLGLRRLDVAESVLAEVWDYRKQVLGESDLQSIASGFQLGQVYFLNRNHVAAVNTHRSILNQRLERFGQGSVEAIESLEVLGLVLTTDSESFKGGFDLLRQALEIRKQVHGLQIDTLSSACRLASLSASHGDLFDASDLFRWVFDNSKNQDSSRMLRSAYASGLAAAGTFYLTQNRREGNDMIGRVVTLMGRQEGPDHPVVRTLAYGRAVILFLQREGFQFRSILRGQFNLQKRLCGSQHRGTLLAGEIYAIGSLLDSLLIKSHIGNDIDNITNWLYMKKQGRTPLVMKFALAACAVFAFADLDELAQSLLKWLYRAQKRHVGLFDRDTLVTLALHHGFHVRSVYRRTKKKPTREHSSQDPRVMLEKMWPKLTSAAASFLINTKATPIGMHTELFATWLPKLLTEWTLFKGYRRERLNRIFMSPEEFFVYPQFSGFKFADFVRNETQSPSSEEDAASRIHTVTSDEIHDEDLIDEENQESDTHSIDFSDIIAGRAEEGLRSLGDSLLDLVMAPEIDDEVSISAREERAGTCFDELSHELTKDAIDEASINAARDNHELFEEETKSD